MYVIQTTKTQQPRYLMRDSGRHISMWSYQIERATRFQTIEEAHLAITVFADDVPCEVIEAR